VTAREIFYFQILFQLFNFFKLKKINACRIISRVDFF